MKRFLLLCLFVSCPAPQDPAGLVQGLRSDDIAVRERAFVELEKLGAAAEAELKKVIADSDAHVADSARRLLLTLEFDRVLSPALKKALPGLARRLGRRSGDEATKVYLEISGDPRDAQGKKIHEELTREDLEPLALPAIRNAITDDDKVAACEAAARWFHTTAEPGVANLLRDPADPVRRAACKALVAFLGRAALPKFLDILRDQPALLVEAVNRYGPRTAYETQGRLIELLRHSDGKVVAGALEALEELEIVSIVPEIRGLLKSGSSDVKLAALGFIDSFDWRECVEEARALLDDPAPAVRCAAALYLWDCDVEVPAPACRRLIEEPDAGNFEYFVRKIPKSAGRDPEVLSCLRKRVKQSTPHVFLALKRLEDPRIEEISIGLLDHENDWFRREAFYALSATGTPRSVEVIRRLLEDSARDEDLRCSAFEKLAASKSLPPQDDLVRLLRGKCVPLAIQVARHLAPLAPELVKAEVPRLILDESLRGSREIRELANLIDPAVRRPLLLKALECSADSPWYVQREMVEHKGDGYVPGLRAFLEEGESEVQTAAIGVLAYLEAVEARPDIVKLMSSPDTEVRNAAVGAVNCVGLGTEVDQVRRLTTDPESKIRRSALSALRRHSVKEATPDFVKLLDDENSDVASEAAEALVEFGNRDMVPKMVEWLGHLDVRWRNELAAEALAVVQPSAAEPGVLAMLNHRDANIRERGAWRMQMFGLKQHARRLLPLLAEPAISDDAVHAIAVLDARDLIPDLEALLADPSSVRRSGALSALAGLQSVASAPRIRKLLDDPDLEIRREAAFTLGDFKDRDAVPRLIEMLGEPVHQVRSAASRALGDIGDSSAAPVLIRLLEKSTEDIFGPAIFALGNLRAKEAAPVLLRLLNEQTSHRSLIIEALGKRGSKEAIPDLIRLLDSSDLAENAAQALAKLGATAAIPAIRRRIEARNQSEFFDLATALADLGDSSALVRALTSKLDWVCAEAARELCLRGDPRGVPILLADASYDQIPPELNALRNPKRWRELNRRPWKGFVRGCRLRVVERIAASAGLAVKWERGKTFRQLTWANDWESVGWKHYPLTVMGALIQAASDEESRRRPLGTDVFDFILEDDAIRFLPHAEAKKFWEEWWAGEQAKLKK